MIFDSTLLFDGTATAPTAVTVTRDSLNTLDMGVVRDMSPGTSLFLGIFGNGLFAAAGAATLTIAIQGSPDNAAWTTYAQTIALSIAQLNASGPLFPIILPRPPSVAVARPRYYKLVYTVATGPFTAGALTAGLLLGRDDIVAYPSGFSTQYV